MRTVLAAGLLLLAFWGICPAARAQNASSDEPSYRKEFVYGVSFNTRGGIIGGASVRSTRVLTDKWARYWSIEGVEVKHPKEQRVYTDVGGSFVYGKTNYLFVLRPSFGAQRVIFRKAPESGVQVNALLGAGPSIGLLMPYYVTVNFAQPGQNPPTDLRNVQYDPNLYSSNQIVDRAPLFTGASEIKPNIGAHLRGALSFEYGRYRDAVAGIETGFLFELYPKRPTILRDRLESDSKLNTNFFPSVYLTLYLGHRS